MIEKTREKYKADNIIWQIVLAHFGLVNELIDGYSGRISDRYVELRALDCARDTFQRNSLHSVQQSDS